MAALRYPSEYDWRYMTVSRLLGADHDPAGYLWARAGIALCGLFGFAWAMRLAQRTLQVGYFFMACAAVLPESLLRVPKGHEMLAILAFVGIWCGIVCVMFQSFVQALLRRMRSATGRARLVAAALVGAAMLSNRYITDRFLPDKAIDLVDEAAARLRMEVDSKPEEIDELDRTIMQLKIEREALKKEPDAAPQDRLGKRETELASLEEQSAE